MEFNLKAIGTVHTSATDDEIRVHDPSVKTTIEIFSEYEEGLQGLEGFSHAFVIGLFNRLKPHQIGPLKVRPRALLKYGFKLEELPLLGVFSLDSPTRPNPIGLSLARLVKIDGHSIFVTGLDYFDGTPVLDIKPYQNSYRVDEFQLPEWHLNLLKRAGRV
jgi:tRNA-Thr(GGU) m(6)t(6)A37 methyltransferase TsaA